MPEIAAAHNIPYVATATHGYPFDLMAKVAKAVAIKGPAYVHILSACPTGWRSATDTINRQVRLAVQTGMFPLYEVENGVYKMSLDIPEAETGGRIPENAGQVPPPERRYHRANTKTRGTGIPEDTGESGAWQQNNN